MFDFLCLFIDPNIGGEKRMMEYPTLYKKEKLTLGFIKDYMSENRAAPSLEEIRSHF